MMMMIVWRGRRDLLDWTRVVAVASGQAGRFVLQILDEVTRLNRVVDGGVRRCQRNCMETLPVV